MRNELLQFACSLDEAHLSPEIAASMLTQHTGSYVSAREAYVLMDMLRDEGLLAFTPPQANVGQTAYRHMQATELGHEQAAQIALNEPVSPDAQAYGMWLDKGDLSL